MIYTWPQNVVDYVYDVFIARFDFWLAFGIVAQLIFTARFLVQWIASERAGRSTVPLAFWILSIVGGTMTLIYGIQKREAVIIMGQVLAVFIYVRNIVLVLRERGQSASG